jgi:hypothetical protein
MKSVLPLAPLALGLLAACSSPSGDPPSTPNPTPLGQGSRIRDVTNPTLDSHVKQLPQSQWKSGVCAKQTVSITGAVVTFIDNFDETKDGKSRGSVYVQDVGSQDPYAGTSLYKPTYLPADLRVATGDVLDLAGPYEELCSVGTHTFSGGVLPQIATPVGTFRYEYSAPDPKVVDVKDFDDYNTGRKWLNMIVTVQNATVGVGSNDGAGRITYVVSRIAGGLVISNELYDLGATDIPPSTTLKSVTGIITWFDGYHIAPRSKDDLVLQ